MQLLIEIQEKSVKMILESLIAHHKRDGVAVLYIQGSLQFCRNLHGLGLVAAGRLAAGQLNLSPHHTSVRVARLLCAAVVGDDEVGVVEDVCRTFLLEVRLWIKH